jgi:hypothetical protein
MRSPRGAPSGFHVAALRGEIRGVVGWYGTATDIEDHKREEVLQPLEPTSRPCRLLENVLTESDAVILPELSHPRNSIVETPR